MTLLLNVYFSFTIQWVPDRDFFSLESDLIYHFVGLESIRIFAYILLCVYFYGLSLFLSIRWPYKILLQSTKVELFI